MSICGTIDESVGRSPYQSSDFQGVYVTRPHPKGSLRTNPDFTFPRPRRHRLPRDRSASGAGEAFPDYSSPSDCSAGSPGERGNRTSAACAGPAVPLLSFLKHVNGGLIFVNSPILKFVNGAQKPHLRCADSLPTIRFPAVYLPFLKNQWKITWISRSVCE